MIVDTFAKIRGHQANNQNLYTGDYDAIGKLKRIADEFDIAMVVIHHTRKADADDPLDMVSGTQGSPVLRTPSSSSRKRSAAPTRTSTCVGVTLPEADHALKFDPEACSWTLMGDAATYKMSKERQEIVDLLTKSRTALTEADQRDAGTQARHRPQDAARHGHRRHDRGDGGVYRIPPVTQQRSIDEFDEGVLTWPTVPRLSPFWRTTTSRSGLMAGDCSPGGQGG